MESMIFAGIIVACVVFIAVCLIRNRPDIIVDFGLRGFIGITAIYLLEMVLSIWNHELNVGINGATFAINGFLGLPGFLLLYGLAYYYSL
ncbi:MAG: Pro-sigmaK processing inhibitor BofA [Clostridiales bacterium]|nr:Pro-sigmaK processing inhibitor BofA [Clostridiales bacterium]